jgi:hypothetical protein
MGGRENTKKPVFMGKVCCDLCTVGVVIYVHGQFVADKTGLKYG